MVQSFTLAALAFHGNPAVWAIYAVAFVGGVTIAFDNPARRSFVVEMVADDEINNAVSLNSALMTASRVVGPALAGLLVTTVGFGWCFLGDGLSYIAVLVALYMMRTEELHPSPVAVRGQGPGARRAALRPQRARAVDPARHDGRDRHARLQLPGRHAAVRHPRSRRHRDDLHAAVLGRQPRLADRGAGHRAAHVDHDPRREPLGSGLRFGDGADLDRPVRARGLLPRPSSSGSAASPS